MQNKGRKCRKRGCNRPAMAKQWCSMHYMQEYRSDPAKRKAANEASKRWRAKNGNKKRRSKARSAA